MKMNEFQELSKRTMPVEVNRLTISNYAMGLCGEAGETTDLLKKHVHHGHVLDGDKFKKELGDVLHYVAGLATMFDLTLEEIAAANIEKLKARYPEGFSEEKSINRKE